MNSWIKAKTIVTVLTNYQHKPLGKTTDQPPISNSKRIWTFFIFMHWFISKHRQIFQLKPKKKAVCTLPVLPQQFKVWIWFNYLPNISLVDLINFNSTSCLSIFYTYSIIHFFFIFPFSVVLEKMSINII